MMSPTWNVLLAAAKGCHLGAQLVVKKRQFKDRLWRAAYGTSRVLDISIWSEKLMEANQSYKMSTEMWFLAPKELKSNGIRGKCLQYWNQNAMGLREWCGSKAEGEVHLPEEIYLDSGLEG